MAEDKDEDIENNENANKRANDAFKAAGLTKDEQDELHRSGELEDRMTYAELKALADAKVDERAAEDDEDEEEEES